MHFGIISKIKISSDVQVVENVEGGLTGLFQTSFGLYSAAFV